MSVPRIGSLFSGAGQLDEGVRSVLGGTVAWHAEIDPAASRVLAHRYPGVPNLGDISAVDWSTVEPVDVLTGGSPCQDLSHAGRRAGMTDGTRSNLWVAMREAVAQLRPSLVVWENVRGAYSACADSDLGRCPRCVDPDSTAGHAPLLRALGRVLGDFSSLGYDARWHGLRAADVGAAHGRFRVFIVAHPAGVPWGVGDGDDVRAGWGAVGRGPSAGCGPATDTRHGEQPERSGSGVTTRHAHGSYPQGRIVAAEEVGSGQGATGGSGVAATDAADVGHERGRRAWDGRTGLADGGEPPADAERRGRDGRAYEPLRCEVGGTAAAGCGEVSRADVFAGRWCACEPPADAASDGRHERRPESARIIGGSHAAERGDAPADAGSARLAQQPGDAPTQEARSHASDLATDHRGERALVDWGPYCAAVERWERVLGRVAPAPTETGPKGGQRLAPRFVEWMMGWPAGWVTDVPGVTRNDALKICGNGVVPQQAAEAVQWLLASDAGLQAA